MRMRSTALVAACAIAAVPLTSGAALAQADFYKGKTISVVVGAKGGSLTLAGQIVARNIGKHIPGNPTVIFINMPGGAHINATNHTYNVAKPDGLTILAANPNVALGQLSKLPQVRFDVKKFLWLGSSGSDGAMFAIRSTLPYKTFAETKASGRELIIGTTGPGSNAHDMPMLLKEFAGIKMRLVAGYAANSDILLAAERQEVDGWAALGTTIKSGVERGAVRPLVRTRAPVSGYNSLPVDESLTTDPVGKSLMAIRGIPLQIGRAFAVHPETPADRVKMLRDAFAKAMADPVLLADAKKAKIEMEFKSHQDVEKGFAELFNQSPQVMQAVNKYFKRAK